MASGGVINWADWAGQCLEMEVVRQRQHVEGEKKQSFMSSMFSRKTGHKKEKKNRADQVSERLVEFDWHWNWNSRRQSDDSQPVSKFSWRSYENCWSSERVSHALVCAEGDDVPGMTRAVFAVGSEGRDHLMEKNTEGKNRGLEVFRLNPGSSQWQQVYGDEPITLQSSPKGRDEHTCCYYRGKIFMYGGHCGSKLFKEVECYDIAASSWSVVESFVDGCAHPAARYSHACTTHDNMMYIHGGRLDSDSQQHYLFSSPDFTAELLSFNMDTLTWREVTPTYRQPPSGGYGGLPIPKGYLHLLRDRHSIVYVDGRIILFGGRGPEIPHGCIIDGQPEYCEGFFSYSFTAKKWARIETSGYSPQARGNVASALCGQGILYYGGYRRSYREQGCLSDLFMMDTATYHITLLEPYGVGPRARVTQMCAVGSDVIILGGAVDTFNKEERSRRPSADFKPLSDMYILHTVPNLQQFCVLTIVRNDIDCSELPPHLQKMVKGSSDRHGGP